MARKTTAKKPATFNAIVGHGPYGITYGEVLESDVANLSKNGAQLTVYNARSIKRWFGGTGGISSLAAYGPHANKDNRIGFAEPSCTILEVKAVHRCTDETTAAFASVVAQR